MNIREALLDRNVLGASPAFADLSTWSAWISFLGAVYGLPLDADGEQLFSDCTGRPGYVPPAGGWREAVAIVGRQAGKTRAAAAVVAFEAAMAQPTLDGERYALLLAQDHRSAMRAAFSYIRSTFESSPLLRRMIVSDTSDTLRLENGVNVAAYPCRPSATRGLRAVVAVLDELAYFTSTDGYATDVEMLRAIRPTLATTGGRLIVLSSPYGQTGALWDLHRRHHGREDAPVLVWQASAPTMNPTLPGDYLARMADDDPEAYRSEVLGEFRAGLALLLDPEQVSACVNAERARELPRRAGVHYRAFADPSGGRADAFTLAVAHAEGEGDSRRCIVDVARRWPAPFNPSGVVAEVCDVLKCYGVSTVTGDRFAAEWPVEQFRAHAVRYEVSPLDRSALYLAMLPTINAQQVELPDDPILLRELRGLERRRGTSGRDRVDHRRGAHDDSANAVAGAVYLVLGGRTGGSLQIREPIIS